MKVAFFGTKPYERAVFDELNTTHQHELYYLEPHLTTETVNLAKDYPAVCCFVNDVLNAQVLEKLAQMGTQLIALRCAGYNNVDVNTAKQHQLAIARVPKYSPYAVAEHAVGLVLALNRKIHRAYNRVRECDFSLHGLMGFDIHGTTVGVIGTGHTGMIFAKIMKGFGCNIIAYDPYPSDTFKNIGAEYVSLDKLYQQSDIISFHCPLTPETQHMLDQKAIQKTKKGVMIINTSRGTVIDTQAVVNALKKRHIGYLGIDVYEEEGDIFFEDCSDKILTDDTLARLQTFPNVIITGHQAFFTKEAIHNIAETTLNTISHFQTHQRVPSACDVN